jgi:undecaprenyl-diphosphatase
MNQAIFYCLNSLAGKSVCFDSLVIFFAQYLGYWLVAGLFALVILGKDKKKEIKMLILTAISVFLSRIIITETIRYFYYSPRPFVVLNDLNQLISHEPTASFPSGHAAFFFALAMAVVFATRWRTWGAIFFLGAILIGVSRVIAGIHWPCDILGGAIIGIISALVAKFISQSIIKPNVKI